MAAGIKRLGFSRKSGAAEADVEADAGSVGKEMRTLFREIETLADFLRTEVRQHYGKDSEQLIQFGLQPFRGVKAKAPEPGASKPSGPTASCPRGNRRDARSRTVLAQRNGFLSAAEDSRWTKTGCSA